MRERKKKKASKIESPQRQLQPPLPQEPERMAAGSSDALKAAVAAGTDNKMVFPSRYLDVPALYETQVSADNAMDILDNIKLLNYDDRLLIADDLRKKLEAFLADSPSSNAVKDLRARMQTSPLREELAMLAIRGLECRQAAEDLAGTENWTLVMRSFGFDTFVRPMGGQMLVKVSGEQEGTSVFDQLVVVREAAMYHRWGPFVCKSDLVHSFKHLDLMVTFELNAPLFHRDCLLRGYACDYSEKDMILICGDSTTPAFYPHLNLPAEPNGWMFKRMSITNFRCQVQLRGVNKGKVILAALIDPKTALPQSIVDFCLQRIVGVLLYLLLRTAERLNDAGDKLGGEYLEVVRSDPYYVEHCLPRILWYCQQRGWEYPVAGTAGGDSVLAHLAGATQAVVEEDRLRAIGAAGAAATTVTSASSLRGRQTTAIVEAEDEVQPIEAAGAAAEKKKKKKHFLRSLFRRKKHAHKHNHRLTTEGLVQVMGGASSINASTSGNDSRSPHHHHGLSSAAASPSSMAVASPQGQQHQRRQEQQLGAPTTRREAEGKVLSWTLPAVVVAYFFVRLTVAPLVRSFSGPVGEAIVLAILLQQVLSLLLKKNVLDAACLPSLGGVDPSHAFFAASIVLALGSVVLTTLQTGTVDLKHIEAPGVWERASLSGNTETVHLVNTGLFLLVLVLIVSQPKIRKEVRRLSSATVTSTKTK
ncbi:hypothetical protein VYU27_001709 [Nannochloropsis oceanica]